MITVCRQYGPTWIRLEDGRVCDLLDVFDEFDPSQPFEQERDDDAEQHTGATPVRSPVDQRNWFTASFDI